MKLFKELAITLIFLALYTPLSIALWYKSGKIINLFFVAIIGLGIVCVYVYAELARYYINKRFLTRRTYIQLREEPEEDDYEEECEEPEVIEPNPIPEYSGLKAFRTLFSKQTHGGEA